MTKEECFNKDKAVFVGLRHSCLYATPSSSFYFNDLEGMSLRRLSTVAGEESITGERLFKTLHDESIIEVCNDFTSELSEYFKFNHTVERRIIGKTGKTFTGLTPRKGARFERYNSDSFQSLYISKITFNSLTACIATLYFETECGITEKEVTVKCGKNTIYLDYTTTEDWLDIYFAADTFEIAKGGNTYSCSCLESCDKCSTMFGCFYGRLFDKETTDTENQYTGDNGLKFDAYCKCNELPLICDFAQDLALAVRMKIGIKLMTEVLVSDDKHPLVRNGKDDANILLAKWNGGENPITGFRESSMYKKLLNPVIKKAKSYLENESSLCIECEHEVGYFESV